MSSTNPAYAELHCLTNFTFLRGASHPEELVGRAAELGYTALAVTDECSVAGVVRAHAEARARASNGAPGEASREGGAGVPKLVVGTEIGLEGGPGIVLLAADRDGYANLCALITRGRRAAQKGRYRLTRPDLEEGVPGCLALLLPGKARGGLVADARWLRARFPGRAWLAVELHHGPDDRARLEALLELGRRAGLAPVAAGDVHMHVRSRRPLQDLLTAVRLGRTVAEAEPELHPNGERHLRSRGRLAAVYPPELLARSVEIAGRCSFSLDELRYEYPEEIVPAGETPASHLRRLTEAGMAGRWPEGAPAGVRRQIERELALIAELGYEPYFLTVHDLVRFARSRGILCQGRGSAANSAVCYCLGITEVDPARMAMLFERFISKERNEPPDIDVDFEHERREEVIQYVYRKYGRERAAIAATVICYRPKSAVRDAGKALGLAPEQVDRLARTLAWWDGGAMVPARLRELGFDPASPVIRRLAAAVETLVGFPRHLSQHVGGFVIARDALSRLVPVENAAMPERTVIQWDKDDLDALGLLKVDVLALGMLSAIRRALDLVTGCAGLSRPLSMADVPAEDPAVYEMIGHADTVGVFQIESRAQMAMLPRMKPRCFYDLVIEVAIVRPGPIQGGMVHPYLRRRQGLEPVRYPSSEVRAVLERTLGVPIFQEQVMQLAVVAAGFTPGEADRLRRAMAAFRRRGSLRPFEARLLEGMRARGYGEQFARQVFEQIKGFGEYGFPESHSASFALLVYVSAWLKRHHPAAFTCALLNSQPMGFYAPSQLVQDARRHGVEVRPVDVRRSEWDCTLEAGAGAGAGSDPVAVRDRSGSVTIGAGNQRGLTPNPRGQTPSTPSIAPALRLGLRMVKGLSEATAARLAAARAERPFADVADLACRAALDRGGLERLAAAGALRGLAGHRHRAHWAALGVERAAPLLPVPRFAEGEPMLPVPGEGDDLVADYAALGLTLGRHPLALLRARLTRLGARTAEAVGALGHGARARAAGLVVNRQRPSTASGVIFATLEDETGFVNLVVWPWVAERQRRALLESRLMLVAGTVEREGEVVHLVAARIEDRSALLGRLETRPRDFR